MPAARAPSLLNAHLASLLDAVPGAQEFDEAAVHAARVASRRLRETLPVAGAAGKAGALRRARKEVRRITRALGPVRELDVALGHVAEFGERGIGSSAVGFLRRTLESERQARRKHMVDALRAPRLTKLRKRVARLSSSPEDQEAASNVMEAAGRRIVQRARALLTAIEHAGSLYLPDRLHTVRIAAKKLRYAVEIDRDLRRSRATARIRQLKGLQDRLGRMHDLEILIDRIRTARARAASTALPLSGELDRLIGSLEEETRKLHAAYMGRRQSMLKLCDALIDTYAAPGRRPAA